MNNDTKELFTSTHLEECARMWKIALFVSTPVPSRIFRALFRSATLALLGVALCPSPSWAAAVDVSGHVTDHLNGAPIANAAVQIKRQIFPGLYAAIATVATDANGYYQWSGDCPISSPPQCLVSAQAAAHVVGEQIFTPQAGAQVVDLVLLRSAVLSGQVRNALGGGALGSVTVLLQRYSESLGAFNGFALMPSESNGAYELSALTPGDYRLCAGSLQAHFMRQCFDHRVTTPIAADQTYSVISLTEGELRTNVDFDLNVGGGFSGQLIDGYTNSPMANTVFSIAVHDASGASYDSLSSTTDASGNYALNGLPDGSYYALLLLPAGFSNTLYPATRCDPCSILGGTPIQVSGGQVATGKTFTAQPRSVIHGRVTDSGTGAGIGGIKIKQGVAAFGAYSTTTTDTSGNYVLYVLSGGPLWTSDNYYYINQAYPAVPCLSENCASLGTYLALDEGDNVEVNFALDRGAPIMGFVAGIGAASPRITLFDSSGAVISRDFGDLGGSYSTPAWLPGTYYLQAESGSRCEVYRQRACPSTSAPITSVSPTPIVTQAGQVTFGIDFNFGDPIFSSGFE